MQSNQQILEKAIEKAIDGGFDHPELNDFEMLESMFPDDAPVPDELKEAGRIKHLVLELRDGDYVNVEAIIFNHDFARALWGEEWPLKEDHQIPFPYWQHKLQAMVIAEDPIKYLGEHI